MSITISGSLWALAVQSQKKTLVNSDKLRTVMAMFGKSQFYAIGATSS